MPSVRPIASEHPATTAELVATVKQAAAAGHRIKVLGGGHSCGGMAATDGVAIVLDNYRRLLHVDRATGLVTVQAGISLGELAGHLAGWGLELPDTGGMADRTIGSSVSTGSHGHGARSVGVASWVAGLDLVTAEGALVSCSARTEPDIFDAARVSLGALGVISTVTLQAGPGFNLRSVTTTVRLGALLDRFDEYLDAGDHTEVYWIPHADVAVVRVRNRTDDRAAGRQRHGRVDRGYRIGPGPRRLSEPVVEYSVPRSAAVSILRRVRDQLAGGHWTLPFPIRVGVAAADRLPMSPATARPSVFIGVGQRAPSVEHLLAEVGRPQWGTRHRQTAVTLRPRYPEWDAWQAVRRRLDPDQRFANAWTRRTLDQTSGQG